MFKVTVESSPEQARLDALGVDSWPIWSHEAAVFPWTYDTEETCYILQGSVTVTPDGDAPVHIGKGDLVTFPAGMSCTWEIHEAIRKYFMFA